MKKKNNLPNEIKKIYYGQSGRNYPRYFIYGIDGHGEKVEVCEMVSPRVFLFKILPNLKKLSENQIWKIENIYDSLQPMQREKDPKSISPKMRNYIFKRDNWTCAYCGHHNGGDKEIPLHVDHKIPVSKGGSNNFGNLITSCRTCNIKKSNKIPQQKEDNPPKEKISLDIEEEINEVKDRDLPIYSPVDNNL